MEGFTSEWYQAHTARQRAGNGPRSDATLKTTEVRGSISRARSHVGLTVITLPITPIGKPRMTRRDQWMKRPCVIRYRTYCDQVRAAWPSGISFPVGGALVEFQMPMPASWSRAKRDERRGQPHEQKPDLDNLLKALLDALHDDDSGVWDVRITKRWGDEGCVLIFID